MSLLPEITHNPYRVLLDGVVRDAIANLHRQATKGLIEQGQHLQLKPLRHSLLFRQRKLAFGSRDLDQASHLVRVHDGGTPDMACTDAGIVATVASIVAGEVTDLEPFISEALAICIGLRRPALLAD